MKAATKCMDSTVSWYILSKLRLSYRKCPHKTITWYFSCDADILQKHIDSYPFEKGFTKDEINVEARTQRPVCKGRGEG